MGSKFKKNVIMENNTLFDIIYMFIISLNNSIEEDSLLIIYI